jgi:hypothetical protein
MERKKEGKLYYSGLNNFSGLFIIHCTKDVHKVTPTKPHTCVQVCAHHL